MNNEPSDEEAEEEFWRVNPKTRIRFHDVGSFARHFYHLRDKEIADLQQELKASYHSQRMARLKEAYEKIADLQARLAKTQNFDIDLLKENGWSEEDIALLIYATKKQVGELCFKDISQSRPPSGT